MNDLLAIAGLSSLAGGLWWIYPPAALVICGALVFALAVCGAVNERRQKVRRRLLQRVKRLRTVGNAAAAEEFE
jgi:hypothetical protein